MDRDTWDRLLRRPQVDLERVVQRDTQTSCFPRAGSIPVRCIRDYIEVIVQPKSQHLINS
jgi:hypothetical protein